MKKNDGEPKAGAPWSADEAVIGALLEVRGVGALTHPAPGLETRAPEPVEGRGDLSIHASDRPFDQLREAVGDSSHPQGLAALAPSSRRHPVRRPSAFGKLTRETVLLAVGGMVLGAIGLMLGFGVFSVGGRANGGGPEAADMPDEHGNPDLVSGSDATNGLTGEFDDADVRFVNVTRNPSDSLTLRAFDARLLHKNLRDLKVQGHGITDESLKAIAEACPDLEGLTLYNTDITDEGFAKHIGTIQKLKRLDLAHSRRITDKGIAGLLVAKAEDFRKPDDKLTLVPVLKNLQSLGLTGFVGQTSVGPDGLPEGYVDPYSKITDESAKTLALCPNIRNLQLYGTQFTDKGLETLLAFQTGEVVTEKSGYHYLGLDFTKVTAKPLVAFGRGEGRSIRRLSLECTGVKSEDLAAIVQARPELDHLSLGGNGFVPLELDTTHLLELKKLEKLVWLRLSWVSCPKGTDWAPLGELTQLESLALDSVRGESNGTILAAIATLTNLKRLELTNISGLAPMTRTPMDASEYASDNPVIQLRALTNLRYLDLSRSSHVLDSALHLLHHDLSKCRIFAADGVVIRPGIANVTVSAGRANLEEGAAVALIGNDGKVASIGKQRSMWFNDLFQGYPEGFRLTSGVPPPIRLSQPCYDGMLNVVGSHRVLAALPSSPVGFADLPQRGYGLSEEGRKFLERLTEPASVAFKTLDRRITPVTVTLPAYDMKQWPKKKIWGSRTPDFAVRINDSKTKGIASAVAISTGPIEDWILKGPGSQAPDGAFKTGTIMAVLKPIPDPQGDDGQFTHHADCEIPRGKHWLIVLCPGHKPHQREFTFDGKPIDLVIDMDEAAKPTPTDAKGD